MLSPTLFFTRDINACATVTYDWFGGLHPWRPGEWESETLQSLAERLNIAKNKWMGLGFVGSLRSVSKLQQNKN